MARPLYSTRFCSCGGTGDTNASYTVPAAYVAIVRDITVVMYPGGDASAAAYIPSLSVFLGSWAQSGSGVTNVQWSGRVVLLAGEELIVEQFTSAQTSVVASGYLLSV